MFAHVLHVHVFFICQMVFNTYMFSHVKYIGMSQGYPLFTPVACLGSKTNCSRADAEPVKETILKESERATPKAIG